MMRSTEHPEYYENLLIDAIRRGDFRTVEEQLNLYLEIDFWRGAHGTPLMWACHYGHEKVIELLLKYGAKTEESTPTPVGSSALGHTINPMEAAIKGRNGACVKFLLDRKVADVDTWVGIYSPLVLAAKENRETALNFLIAEYKQGKNRVDSRIQNFLGLACPIEEAHAVLDERRAFEVMDGQNAPTKTSRMKDAIAPLLEDADKKFDEHASKKAKLFDELKSIPILGLGIFRGKTKSSDFQMLFDFCKESKKNCAYALTEGEERPHPLDFESTTVFMLYCTSIRGGDSFELGRIGFQWTNKGWEIQDHDIVETDSKGKPYLKRTELSNKIQKLRSYHGWFRPLDSKDSAEKLRELNAAICSNTFFQLVKNEIDISDRLLPTVEQHSLNPVFTPRLEESSLSLSPGDFKASLKENFQRAKNRKSPYRWRNWPRIGPATLLAEIRNYLDNGGEVDDVHPKHDENLLMGAMRSCRPDIMEFLLKRGASVEQKTRAYGRTALHFISNDADDAEVSSCVKLLMQYKADVNPGSTDHETPLMIATRNQQVQVVKLLLESKAKPHVSNSKKKYLIDIAEGEIDMAPIRAHRRLVDLHAEGKEPEQKADPAEVDRAQRRVDRALRRVDSAVDSATEIYKSIKKACTQSLDLERFESSAEERKEPIFNELAEYCKNKKASTWTLRNTTEPGLVRLYWCKYSENSTKGYRMNFQLSSTGWTTHSVQPADDYILLHYKNSEKSLLELVDWLETGDFPQGLKEICKKENICTLDFESVNPAFRTLASQLRKSATQGDSKSSETPTDVKMLDPADLKAADLEHACTLPYDSRLFFSHNTHMFRRIVEGVPVEQMKVRPNPAKEKFGQVYEDSVLKSIHPPSQPHLVYGDEGGKPIKF